MTSSAEDVAVLEAAVTGIPKVAELIALASDENQAAAFDVAERTYLQTAKDLGGTEEVAQKLASAVMLKLRAAVEEQILANRSLLKALHEELIGEPLEAESVETAIKELVHKTYGSEQDNLNNEAGSKDQVSNKHSTEISLPTEPAQDPKM